MAAYRKWLTEEVTNMRETKVPRIPIDSADIPVLLALLDGERTGRQIAQQTQLPVYTVNSVLERLLKERLVLKSRDEVRGSFVEPCYALADGSAALATAHARLVDNPLPLLIGLLQGAQSAIPRAVANGARAGVWYSRLKLSVEASVKLVAQLEQTMHTMEALQDTTEEMAEQQQRLYHVLVAYYDEECGTDPNATV